MTVHKRILCILLVFLLSLCISLPVFADEPEETETQPIIRLKISNTEEFLTFAENCRLDSYSENLSVTLEKDIDLDGVSFTPVPIFSGVFDGKGHTISGLSVTVTGSMQGLFRYLTDTAVVRNLTAAGTVHPGGSRNQIGALAGKNEGQILNCSFSGSLSGAEHVGGIAGLNTVTGVIDGCHVSGDINGDHFVGGIAGENYGVIRNCTNDASVNTTPLQNDVSVSDITMETLTDTEAVNTVTDIGGIAGISRGVIRSCKNKGNIGYQHMGYNIGGIAGAQSGYIVACENNGSIQGRKEIGGVVGQAEPAARIEYSEDTLQILHGQLGTMSGLVNRVSGNAQTNAGQISEQIWALQEQAEVARKATEVLIPDPDATELPDADTILAAQNSLTSAVSSMPDTVRGIASATQTTVGELTNDLGAISAQVGAMGETVSGASENLGGSITDISDEDTGEQLTGKVESCVNNGSVLADLNVGGIIGAIAMENDLDISKDWEEIGEGSLNFKSELRAVVLHCENRGEVKGKKQNVGGIAGWQSLGLIRDCVNTGGVEAEGADYVGGISGLSTGFIRFDHAKGKLVGRAYVGGIAGSGTIVTDCISMVRIENGVEKLGAILGEAAESRTSSEEMPISGNIYPVLASDIGAIDSISYAGLAEGVDPDAFLSREDLPEFFRKISVRFVFADGTEQVITLRPGDGLSGEQIPDIPQKDGFAASWDGIDRVDLENIVGDLTFEVLYTPHSAVIESAQTDEGGRPIVLIEGVFPEGDTVSAEKSDSAPILTEKETLLQAWDVCVPGETKSVRLLMPDDADDLVLYVSAADENWQTLPYRVVGSYAVFEIEHPSFSLAFVQPVRNRTILYCAAAGVVLLLIVSVWLLTKRKRRMKTKA